MEWFQLRKGRIAISEVGARPPGAQFTSLLSWAHDLDFYSAWPRLMVFDDFEPPARKYAVGAAYFRGQGRGRVRAIHGLDEAQRRFGHLVVEARLPRAGQAPADSYEGDGYVIIRHPDSGWWKALQHIVTGHRGAGLNHERSWLSLQIMLGRKSRIPTCARPTHRPAELVVITAGCGSEGDIGSADRCRRPLEDRKIYQRAEDFAREPGSMPAA
jgi:hypothetical protein